MTDKLKSLAILCKSDNSNFYKKTALQDFKENWKKDNLVINKWIAVQASSIPENFGSEESDTISENFLENIKNIEQEEFFDIKNPNKVRALFGSFGRNKVMFHDINFSGKNPVSKNYKYITQKILEIDEFNNKASSGLAHVFDEYEKLAEENKVLIKKSLEKILNHIPENSKKISDALFEVVSKILKRAR